MNEMAKVRAISPEQAKGLFGPVYHGTNQDNRNKIDQDGFKLFFDLPKTGNVSNGYNFQDYSNDIPPPIHHLGYGIYFTTNKTIASMYNGGTQKGLVAYYLDIPRKETINFGSTSTIMKWWQKNGYNMLPISKIPENERNSLWIDATKNLTNSLKSRFDGVWFKGKGISRLLDGDQVVVFDPSRIHFIDNSLSVGYEPYPDAGFKIKIGDRFKVRNLPISGKIIDIKPKGKSYWDIVHPSNYRLIVKLSDKNLSLFRDDLYQAILADQDNPFFDTRKINHVSAEGSARSYLSYMMENVEKDFPSGLVERILKPRESVK